jgi:hypothetical protein
VKSRGIQSIEVGGRLLQALARAGDPMMMRDLAREAGMTPAKAHPYLVSFSRLGLVERNDITIGQYSNQRTRTPIAPMIRERIGLRIVRRRAGSAQ